MIRERKWPARIAGGLAGIAAYLSLLTGLQGMMLDAAVWAWAAAMLWLAFEIHRPEEKMVA